MKIKSILIASFVLAFAAVFFITFHKPAVAPSNSTTTSSKSVNISITYDTGSPVTFSPELPASASALTLLENITQTSGIPLETKKYSFGTLVESINGLKNTTDKAWIYFVNGSSASVGADQYQVKPGDFIDWKYVKPQF